MNAHVSASRPAKGPMLGFDSPRPVAHGPAIPDPVPIALRELLIAAGPAQVRGDLDVAVSDVAYASAAGTPGSLFFCVPGQANDGHDFAADAIARGATALVVQRWVDVDDAVTQVLVPSVRIAMGPISAAFFGHPAAELVTIGVTGTNGKTTTSYLLESIYRAAGLVPGVIGTTGVHVAGTEVPTDHTTPEAPDVHRLLRRMVDDGVQALAMEVSSHGLDQHRVGGLRFAVAAFTNLSQDHLDYHPSLEHYFEAKRSLFTPEQATLGVVNVGDEWGVRLAQEALIPVSTFAVGSDRDAALVLTDGTADAEGVAGRIEGRDVRSHLRGAYNLENVLAAYAAARAGGLEVDAILAGIADLPGVPGRMEVVGNKTNERGSLVLVDYAHTPGGVETMLASARGFTAGRLIVVLGCGGDRDQVKRPLMGKAATSAADLTIVTSDNPRTEDPLAIIAQIEAGARDGGGAYEVQPDRRLAIRTAIERSGAGDVVVIAGKGHETGQIFADRTTPFDDRLVAAEELADLEGDHR